MIKNKFPYSVICLGILISSVLVGCGNNGQSKKQTINILNYNLEYNGNIQLERVGVHSDDPQEIIELYQEVGDSVEYRDSLLVAEKYAKGLGVLAFSKENLDTLKDQGLVLENIKRTGISSNGIKDALLLEYEITEGFISDVPLLYVSQLFVPIGENIMFMSFISDNINSRNAASSMFKNIE